MLGFCEPTILDGTPQFEKLEFFILPLQIFLQ